MDDSRESRQDIERLEAELRRQTQGADHWSDSCQATAEELARLLLDAGVELDAAAERLRSAGVSRKSAWRLVHQVVRDRDLAEKQTEEVELAHATPICPYCMHPVDWLDHFCPNCAGPVTAIASFDPMGQIYSSGRAYRLAATDKKPKGIVVLAMWLIFGPIVISLISTLCIFAASYGWIRLGEGTYHVAGDRTAHAIWLVLAVGAFVLYTAILWKTTAHWLRWRQQRRQGEDGQDGDQGAKDDSAEQQSS